MTALALVLWTAPFAQAASPGEQCHDLFTSLEQYHAEIQNQMAREITRDLPFNPAKGLATYRQLAAHDQVIARLFPEREVTRIFATEEMPYFERSLENLMSELALMSGETGAAPSKYLAATLKVQLRNRVPAAQIDQRIELFMAGQSPIERILGENTSRETLVLFHGGNPLKPTPESLMGQYLSETGAASVARRFNTQVMNGAVENKQGEGSQGEERLAVAVSASTFAVWQKYFNRVDMLSVFAHAQVVQNGKVVSYNANYADLRSMSAGNILPALVLKTTEAQRMEFYLSTIANRGENRSWSKQAMVPWKVENFCSMVGGYETCTHWIGNAPIGDKRVDEYHFPGAMDDYAQNPLGRGVTEETKMNPRVAKLSWHAGAEDPRLNKLYQAPGYQQLSAVVGQTTSNVHGEWANPGWLISTLIGPTSNQFVPFVFIFTDDAKTPLDPKFVPRFEKPL
jgi:hypothetical protein